MPTLVFATQNQYKIDEISDVLLKKLKGTNAQQWNIIGLKDIECAEDIPETSDTIEGNALQKAMYVYERYGYQCFADDTGLEVDALNGQPGVYSARFAGPEKNFSKNIRKLLAELGDAANRKARFRTVIALVLESDRYLFEGVIEGNIIHERRGEAGFGYDPVFVPDGHEKTFAEMSLDEKNEISHRALATVKLVDFLQNYSGK